MKENDKRRLYLSEKLKNMAYNTRYNILKYFEEYALDSLGKPNNEIYILGQKLVITESNRTKVLEQICEIFQTTPWITYRSGFPKLENQKKGTSYVSDTGWGCMVRVGQMLFAEIIKYHRKVTTKAEILNILVLFSDVDATQIFSIHNIVQMAKGEYDLKPGQWYNPSQISYILKQLYEMNLQKQEKLKIVVSNSGNLFFQSLSNEMLDGKNNCRCLNKSTEFICPNSNCNRVKNAVALIVLSRLGLNGPQKKYLAMLQKLMEIQFCKGVIGGKPEKALYFIGKQNDHFIYLDPHYVQQAEKDVQLNRDTYFCESFRMCKSTSIDSSIGICFYLRDIQEFNKFYKQINELKNENEDNFFIFVSDQIPFYAMSNSQIKINSGIESVIEML